MNEAMMIENCILNESKLVWLEWEWAEMFWEEKGWEMKVGKEMDVVEVEEESWIFWFTYTFPKERFGDFGSRFKSLNRPKEGPEGECWAHARFKMGVQILTDALFEITKNNIMKNIFFASRIRDPNFIGLQ